jgi:exopolysaccharide biosynthesis protein
LSRMLLFALIISLVLSAIVFLYLRYGNIPSDTAMIEAEQEATSIPTPAETSAPPPTLEELEDDIWQDILDGIEKRRYLPNDNPISELIVMRIDPKKFDFRAHYLPATPLSITEWIERLPNAEIIINANFFDEEYLNLGLLITDGQVHGTPYTDRGGWFAVVDGVPHVRSNVEDPYNPAEDNLDQAVQAFPMLVLNGEGTDVTDNGLPSRRTIIGMDSEGRVLIISTPVLGMALSALAEYLPTTDMDLVNAFALDGGRSTMLSFASADLVIPSIEEVPSVLAVYPK